MRFPKFTTTVAAVALVALGVSTGHAGDRYMKGDPEVRYDASAGMPCQGGQMESGPCMKMRMEERSHCCLKHRMEWEGRHHRGHMERACCCCCCCSMGWRGQWEGEPFMMMGSPGMKGSMSFSTASFDEWLRIKTGPSDRGDLLVTEVLPGGPAEKAGIQPQDILTSVNGVSFLADQRETLASLIQRGFADGKVVTVTALRAGKVMPIDVTLEAPAKMAPAVAPATIQGGQPSPMAH